MKKEMKKLDVVFILDKSGSMSGSEEHTISSFNEYLEKEKKNSFPTKITTVLFNDSYSYLYQRRNIMEISNLTHEDYSVSGCTALYDALGNTISYMSQVDTDKVLFIIITDGYENASKEFQKETIRRMIKNHAEWDFIYVGADIDSFSTGGEIGIRRDNIANFKKDKKGLSKLFKAVGEYECAMMEEESPRHWKDELNDYLNDNQ